jgi:glycosyltransferase involved in cell wall biosynthesis
LSRPKFLILTDWFSPGYKAGGPIRSVVNLAQTLQSDLHIWVYTGNADHNSKEPYEGVPSDEWVKFDQNIQVFYASPEQQNLKTLKNILQEVQPDCIYLNSMFSKHFTIAPLRLLVQGQIKAPVVLAPRGMLKKSALQFKKNKKKVFLQLWKSLGIHKKIHFHATTEEEAAEVRRAFGHQVSISIINNMPAAVEAFFSKEPAKVPKFVFVGRIHPIKGLDLLLETLKKVNAPLQLSIVGNKEDLAYWKSCQKIIAELPPYIQVNDLGEVPHHQLKEILLDHHFFILPTQGENFGHAIFEALACGLPVIISDQTPWRALQEKKVGWDLALKDQQVL